MKNKIVQISIKRNSIKKSASQPISPVPRIPLSRKTKALHRCLSGPATADPVVLQGPADVTSAADLAALLGLLPSSIHHHAAGDAAGASSGSLDLEKSNLIDFGTTTTAPPHLAMEVKATGQEENTRLFSLVYFVAYYLLMYLYMEEYFPQCFFYAKFSFSKLFLYISLSV